MSHRFDHASGIVRSVVRTTCRKEWEYLVTLCHGDPIETSNTALRVHMVNRSPSRQVTLRPKIVLPDFWSISSDLSVHHQIRNELELTFVFKKSFIIFHVLFYV